MSDRTCSIEGCAYPHKSLGYCNLHYVRFKKRGHPGGADRERAEVKHPLAPEVGQHHDTELCAWWEEPCSHLVYSQDLCKRHYNIASSTSVKAPRFRTLGSLKHHEITDIDERTSRATCLVCGPEARFEWRKTGGRGVGARRVCIGLRNASQRWLATGWSEEQFDLALIAQGNRCVICRKSPVGRGRHDSFHSDHCHAAKYTRALLCGQCNHMLGMADDDAIILQRAANYLTQHARGIVNR